MPRQNTNKGTYRDADISDNTVTDIEVLHVLALLNDFANGFVTGDELRRASDVSGHDNER